MESELLVFISSIMNKDLDDLTQEREEAEKAIQSLYLTAPWRFESTPASSERVDLVYLNKVKACDLFIVILNKSITKPVLREYDEANRNKKPILVFIKKNGDVRTPDLKAFIGSLQIKYREYFMQEFSNIVKESVRDELIRAFRSKNGLREMQVSQELSVGKIRYNYAHANFYALKRSDPRSPLELIKEDPESDKLLPLMAEIPILSSFQNQIEFAQANKYVDLYADSCADLEMQLIGFHFLKDIVKKFRFVFSMYDAGCANCGQFKALSAEMSSLSSQFRYYGQDYNSDWGSRFNAKNGEFVVKPLPFVEDRQVELVACTHVLHILEKNPIAIYASFYSFNRLLAKNGYCYITVPAKDSQPGMHDVLEKSARDAGFEIIQSVKYRLNHTLTNEPALNVTTFIYLLLKKKNGIGLKKWHELLGISFFRAKCKELAQAYSIDKEEDISQELTDL